MVGQCLAPVLFFIAAVDCYPVDQDKIDIALLWQLVQSRLPTAYMYDDGRGNTPIRFTSDIRILDLDNDAECLPHPEPGLLGIATPSEQTICMTFTHSRYITTSGVGWNDVLVTLGHEVAHLFTPNAARACHHTPSETWSEFNECWHRHDSFLVWERKLIRSIHTKPKERR